MLPGGINRGRAMGNVYNHGDPDPNAGINFLTPVKGSVYVYVTDINPSNVRATEMKPMAHAKMTVENSIAPVLENLVKKYNPISGMF